LLTTCEFIRKNWKNVPNNRETASGERLVTPALKHKQEKNVAKYKIVLNLHKGHNRNFIIDCQACHSKTNNPK